MAYHFPRKIVQHAPAKYVHVYVNVQQPSIVKRAATRQIIEFNQANISRDDTDSIYTITIAPYDYLTVKALDPSPGLILNTPTGQRERQALDTLHGNSWKWGVRTDSGYGTASFRLLVTGERNTQTDTVITDRNIPINIELDKNLIAVVWTWLMNHPESLLTLLLIPLAKWLWNLIRGKKDKGEG